MKKANKKELCDGCPVFDPCLNSNGEVECSHWDLCNRFVKYVLNRIKDIAVEEE